MDRFEEANIKKMIDKEVERNKILSALKNDKVFLDYLNKLKELGNKQLKLSSLDINKTVNETEELSLDEIIKQLMDNFEVRNTNGIYVCLNSYRRTRVWHSEDYGYYLDYENLPIDSEDTQIRHYIDIENRFKLDYTSAIDPNLQVLLHRIKMAHPLNIKNFEDSNIVLNPYNTNENSNGLEEVRFEFFKKAYETNNEEAKKYILDKYPRINKH